MNCRMCFISRFPSSCCTKLAVCLFFSSICGLHHPKWIWMIRVYLILPLKTTVKNMMKLESNKMKAQKTHTHTNTHSRSMIQSASQQQSEGCWLCVGAGADLGSEVTRLFWRWASRDSGRTLDKDDSKMSHFMSYWLPWLAGHVFNYSETDRQPLIKKQKKTLFQNWTLCGSLKW